MADDAEILDWGGEDDEHYGEGLYRTASMGDGDDVVSIGGEEDDMKELAAFQSRSLRDNGNDDSPTATARPLSVQSGKVTPRRDSGDARFPPEPSPPGNKSPYDASAARRNSHRRSRSQSRSLKAPLTHALPPKPVVATPSYRARTQSNPGFMSASVMSSSRRTQDKDGSRRRANGSSKPHASDTLPPDWVIRHSTGKGGETGETYYYNVRTDISQWERPLFDDDRNGKASPLIPRDIERTDYRESHPDSKTTRSHSSGDVRSERRVVDQTSRGRDQPRPASPVHDLSYSDRHYRPAGGGDPPSSGVLRRDRHEAPAVYGPVQGQLHSGAFDGAPSSQNRLHPGRDSPSQQLGLDESRPRRNSFSEQSDLPAFPREFSRGGGPLRASHGSGPDRGRGIKRNMVSMQDIKARPQRFANNFGEDAAPHVAGQLRAPPPLSGDDALPSSYRRYRSRSPPPTRIRDLPSHHGRNNLVPEINDSMPGRGPSSRSVDNKPVFQQGGPAQHQPWNLPAYDRRDAEAPMDFDLPPRRPRESEYNPKTSMGVDAKRRRLDERTADSAHVRRDRSLSPSPAGSLGQLHQSASYPGGRDGQQHRRENSENFHQQRRFPGQPQNYAGGLQGDGSFSGRSGPGGLPDRPREGNIDGRSINGGPSIPSGPRIRNTQSVAEIDREPIDPGRRQIPPVGLSAHIQQHGRQGRFENRRFDGGRQTDRAETDRTPEVMEVDLPPRARAGGPLRSSGSMYSDRMPSTERRDSLDRLPTGPRAMHSKGSMPPSPITGVSTLLPQSTISAGTPSFGGGNLSPPGGHPDGSRGRRQTRFGSRPSGQQQPSESHVELPSSWPARDIASTKDAGSSEVGRREPIVTQNEPPRTQDRPSPSETLRHFQDGSSYLRGTSPKLTGSNNVPVPPRKGWKNVPDAIEVQQRDYADSKPSWEEPVRASHRADRSIDRGGGMASFEARHDGLHDDIQRRMSLSGRPNAVDDRVPSHNQPRRLNEPGQAVQHGQSSAHDSSNARRPGPRVSRFSKPSEGASPSDEITREPREWIPREDVAIAHGESQTSSVHRGDRRAASPPPRSVETVRSSLSHAPVENFARQGKAFEVNRSLRERSPGGTGDRRMNVTPAYEGSRGRPSADFRDVRHDDARTPAYTQREPSRQVPPSPSSTSRPLYSRLDGPSNAQQGTRADFRGKPGSHDSVERRDNQSVDNSIGNNPSGVHPSRLPMVAYTPVKDKEFANHPDMLTDETRTSQPPSFRIIRPHSKFSDAPQRLPTGDPGKSLDSGTRESNFPPRTDFYERPNQLRSNSLLERLNMSTESEITGTSQPSLRERVDLPPKWKNNDFDNSAETFHSARGTPDAEDMFSSSYGDGNRRGQGRGRGRGGRPRRGRGRGGFGSTD
ncbi:hypothetical protein M0805_000595 [Coniferiporia weirii]|nr:hypothetical protein M0805_000595 [Coniferiporia weirii]